MATSRRRRARSIAACAALLGCAAAGARAEAARLDVKAPPECVEASAIGEQVDGLLGQPLAAVDGVDFQVEIAAGERKSWRLRLDSLEAGGAERRTRELAAQSCAEVADAAAVAIAMTIRSSVAEREARRAAAPPPSPLPPPPPAVEMRPPAPPAAEPAARKSLALALVVDSGAMPSVGVGAGLQAALRFRRLRVAATGALFLAQKALVSGTSGGDFQLAVAGALACFDQELGRVELLACGGGEAGRLAGEGTGVAHPRSQGALWLAGRAELGARVALSSRLGLVIAFGATVPARRPQFLLDGATVVHQPDAVTARVTTALEVDF